MNSSERGALHLWSPNPDRAVATIEADLYRPGFHFLARLYGAALGVPAPRRLQKALGDPRELRPPGWGELARLFRAGASPEQLVARWQVVVDRLADHLLPDRTKEELATRTAIRTHLYGRVRARVGEALEGATNVGVPTGMSALARESQAWTRLKLLEGVRDLDHHARRAVVETFLHSREAGEDVKALQRKLFDRFSEQNRDWRRLALTETAAAVSNGTLVAVDPEEGWEAEWVASPTACAWCRRWHGQSFRVMSPEDPRKDGQREVWPGKSNLGRSPSPRRRDGHLRGEAELWWPAQPCHPNCRCQWVMRRAFSLPVP
ncbi:MAG: hypothetical protein HYZ13_09085 [Acidobacteria bacterium]|nr:hypothetical protein [Acidobacteriota bacterium]